MGRKSSGGSTPLWRALLSDPDQMLALYDQAAQEVVDIGRPEGYYDGWSEEELRWPASSRASEPTDGLALEKQARLVGALYTGVPERRDNRLADAREQFARLTPPYREATRLYLQLRRAFLERGAGSAQEFLELYQSLYLDALAAGQLFVPDAGEAALERARITRVPLAHAQAGAGTLAVTEQDDRRGSDTYACTIDGEVTRGTLRELLRLVAKHTLAYIEAGELLATRFNTYSNFALFGSSVWKVIIDAQLLLHRLSKNSGALGQSLAELRHEIHRGQSMMIEFFQAHREDPARLKPASYWYGHQYSYLTRDIIDYTVALVERANLLVRRARRHGIENGQELAELVLPPLMRGQASGRFLDYPHVGKRARLSRLGRTVRLARWILPSLRNGSRKRRLARRGLAEERRLELNWPENLRWGDAMLRAFDIEVKVTVDPDFFPIARELDLENGKQKILFLPTHQSILDHPVMYRVLESRELLAAMGWPKPVPCTIFARARMGMAGLRIGRFSFTMFGMTAETFDRLLEEVDGYVIADRSGDTRNAIQRFAKLLEKRPGVIYPALTTAAFDIQSPPLQHSLFALLPQDVVVIPLAFRGTHALWPKCPKGNLSINPGQVEVVVSPPILGETTLLPRRRSLRVQLESAALFQAVHLTNLLNPEPSTQ